MDNQEDEDLKQRMRNQVSNSGGAFIFGFHLVLEQSLAMSKKYSYN